MKRSGAAVSRLALNRVAALVPIMLGVTFLVFALLHIMPGDPARAMLGPEASQETVEALREELGLNRPFLVQYGSWLWRVVQLDLGRSVHGSHDPVTEIIARHWPATLELTVVAMFFATLFGAITGIVSAVRANHLVDHVARTVTFLFLAMPGFWLALEMVIIFSHHLGWLPATRRGEPVGSVEWIRHMVMPGFVLGTGTWAFLSRILRSSMLEVLGADYIRTARAKGLPERRVVFKHALKNALIPFVTIAGMSLGALLGGAVITETVFSYPGIGREMIGAILARDAPVVQGIVLLLAGVFVLTNLAVDLLYMVLDPRIRVGGAAG
ncbi:MAG: ABC transporter permease [Candidatus Sumerlaeia bacterium]|nr:ABC transporter permease [Candidatus Sumerlaeia bacterium]